MQYKAIKACFHAFLPPILRRNILGSILFVLQIILPKYCIIINAVQKHTSMLVCFHAFLPKKFFILNPGLTRYSCILCRNILGSILFVLQIILPRYCIIINAVQRHKSILPCFLAMLNLGLT